MSQTLVLSVGSDPAVLDTRGLVLRSAGYIVVSAISVQEAIHLFEDGDFDVVVLCNTLPQKDCESLIYSIRASGARVPIVHVSGTWPVERIGGALDKDPAVFLGSVEDVLSKQVQTQHLEVPARFNNRQIALVRKAPRSSTALIEKREGDDSSNLFERTKARAAS
jgi:CheY-like chemotaxis protein